MKIEIKITKRKVLYLTVCIALIAMLGLVFAVKPNPGHSWSEIGDLPGTIWHSNNDGSGSGLDADTVDGRDFTTGWSWSEIKNLPGTIWHSNNDGSGSGLDADTVDGKHADKIQDADDYVSNAGYASTAGNADTVDGKHAADLDECQIVNADCGQYCSSIGKQFSGGGTTTAVSCEGRFLGGYDGTKCTCW
ncbi:MAG: hypothetical protein Q8O03_07580, partial [Nanoarchaeota archaeon]|nr:hypothetical protein [Nanoarchaeota archaeon]